MNIDTKDSLVNKWCTVFVFWSDVDVRKGNYVVLVQDGGERIQGQFLCQEFSSPFTQSFIDMFGVYDIAKSHKIIHGFHGDVAFFELYIQKNAKESMYPDDLRDLVIKSQSIIF